MRGSSTLVVERAVGDLEVSDEGPHLVVGPEDYGVEANERRVSFVGIARCCHSLIYLGGT